MIVIGITGGIGTGKSTVSDYLRDKGYFVIDADQISRDMTTAGSPAVDDIAKAFGSSFVDDKGELRRKKLAQFVFADTERRKILEKIITDKVVDTIKIEIKDLRNSGKYDIIFLDAPLLFETGVEQMLDAVWLIIADMDTRISRVMARDGITREDILSRINSQMSDEEKKKHSQEIIDNTKGKDKLYESIESLIKKYV